MANQTVIVSVLGDTKNFSRAMSGSSKILKGFAIAAGAAFLAAGRAIGDFIGDSVLAAEDAMAVQRKFEQMAVSSRLFGNQTKAVTTRIEEYARTQAFATGVDDEAILTTASKVLAFRNVAKSADEVNGVFDRTIAITQDVAAVMAGTGDSMSKIETIGPRIAKALDNPARNLNALAKIGVQFNDQEREKIVRLQESNGLFAAQDYLLQALELRYGGTAEAGAQASEKIRQRFEDLQEQVGAQLLPSIEKMADEFGAWLDGPAGKAALAEFVGSFKRLGDYLANPENITRLEKLAMGMGKLADQISRIFEAIDAFNGLPRWLVESLLGSDTYNSLKNKIDYIDNNPSPSQNTTGGNPSAPGGPADRLDRRKPNVTVNISGAIDPYSTGREVTRALDRYSRVGR